MFNPLTNDEALAYHAEPTPGKLGISVTKSFKSQRDLSLAYTPGVAVPCLAIKQNPEDAYRYTAKANLIGVISNGTAVLGLGDIGAQASKPVMEGKAVLFKKFSDLDAFDIEVDTKDIERFCSVVEAIAPTFGGINLEDIMAPECFEIEKRLAARLDIPVMHDDQHGTAVISAAGIMNACRLTGRDIKSLRIVIVGAGAAAISCARLYRYLGVENIILIDSKGVVHTGRSDLNAYKTEFAIKVPASQSDAFEGAHVVVGLSRPGAFSTDDVKRMAENPVVFTLANPIPEIMPELVREARPDAIVATGRSDFPNQVNNVLGFPFIFRGAVDVRAKAINTEMKIAAAEALARLARTEVPAYLNELYGTELTFGRDYLIPKPFDRRLIVEVSSAVAAAALHTGVARIGNFDIDAYRKALAERICVDCQPE
ncbi:MAG: malate dehydrogenase [Campylobacterales bacterium]|nr:malate dehydrogenase [Campylobacterales bacterium]